MQWYQGEIARLRAKDPGRGGRPKVVFRGSSTFTQWPGLERCFPQVQLGMSGRYDLAQPMATFRDLFQGYVDEAVYLDTPNRFLAHLADGFYLASLRRLDITLAVEAEDAFLADNRFLSQLLHGKGIAHQLHVWAGETHAPPAW